MTHVVLLWHTDALHPGLHPSLLRFVEALLSFKSPPSYPEDPILRLVCRGWECKSGEGIICLDQNLEHPLF